MKVFHGGNFRDVDGQKTYVGGACKLIRDCDPDLMSMLELHDIRKSLGYPKTCEFWCVSPGSVSYEKIVQIKEDEDVIDMVKCQLQGS